MSTILPPALRLTPPPANLGSILIRLREQVYEITGDLSHLGEHYIGANYDFSLDGGRWELKHNVYSQGQKGILWEMAMSDTPEQAIERFRSRWEKNSAVIALRESGQIKAPAAAPTGKWVWVAEAGKETPSHG